MGEQYIWVSSLSLWFWTVVSTVEQSVTIVNKVTKLRVSKCSLLAALEIKLKRNLRKTKFGKMKMSGTLR